MAFYWFWEDVSPVRRLRDEYDELINYLDTEIRKIDQRIRDMHGNICNIHDKYRSYRSAEGWMADLYYEKIEDSTQNYFDIVRRCYEAKSQIAFKRTRAIEIRDKLQYYYGVEQREDKKFQLWEISI